MRARMESMDLLANNLANASTAGFKADREFYSLYAAAEAIEPGQDQISTLPVIERQWTDFNQGTLTQTGNSLDFALNGKGFFKVQRGNDTLLTRSGNFRLSAAGELQTQDGYALKTKDGKTIVANGRGPLDVNAGGSVTQSGQVLGQLDLADVVDAAALEKLGSTYFKFDPRSTAPVSAETQVQQGQLEGANVSSADSAVRLVSIMRQFEMLQRAVGIGAEMNRKAVEEVAKV